MNQGIAFSRTLRALEADDFRASRLGLLAAAILLVAWTWWIFAARVPQYESTNNVRVESGRVVAYFPPDAITQIQTGQPAIVRWVGNVISSRVQSVASDRIELALPANSQLPTASSSSASADIETSRVSPAAVALRMLTRGER